MPARILVIDDDETLLKSLEKILRLQGYAVDTAAEPKHLGDLFQTNAYACTLLDLGLPGVENLDLLKELLRDRPLMPVIMISGQGDIRTAVESILAGAYDFIEKPIEPERLLLAVKNAIQQKNLLEEKGTLLRELQERFRMIGESATMQVVFSQIQKVAPTEAKVLVLGESGTGKELVARAIHDGSARLGKPWLRLNCAAIPAELLESELFGHRKGAFTGALTERRGKFLEADGGSLFLDEIGDMPLHLQAKLLRVLESNEIEMIGDNFPRKVDVRVIAATNRNLQHMVSNGTFREELYHRLNVVRITLPPLRDRASDILPLAYHFLNEFNNAYNKQVLSIQRRAAALLQHYPWPGNVRELRNVIEKMVVFARGRQIEVADVQGALEVAGTTHSPSPDFLGGDIVPLRQASREFEKQYLLRCLRECGWRMQAAAKTLDIDRTNLYKKMRKHGLNRSAGQE